MHERIFLFLLGAAQLAGALYIQPGRTRAARAARTIRRFERAWRR